MRSLVEVFVFSVLLGVFLYLGNTIYQTENLPSKPSTVGAVAKNSKTPSKPQRSLASVENRQLQPQYPLLHIDCSNSSVESRSVKEAYVRLTSKNCFDTKGRSIAIKNQNNGLEAQIFVHQNKKVFSTDLIHLSKGENNILLANTSNNDKSVKVLTLTLSQ